MFKPWYSEADEAAMQRRPEAYVAVLWGARALLYAGKRKRVGAALADAGAALFGPVAKWWRPLCEEAIANLIEARQLPALARFSAAPRVQVVARYDEHPDPERAAELLDDVARYLVDDWCDHATVSRCVILGGVEAMRVDFSVLSPERRNFIGDPSSEDGRRLLPRLAWPADVYEHLRVVEQLDTWAGSGIEVLEVSLVDDPPDQNARIIRGNAEPAPVQVGRQVKLTDRWKRRDNGDGTQTWHRPLDEGADYVVRVIGEQKADGRRLYTPGFDLGDFDVNPVVTWANDPPAAIGRLVKQDDRGERLYRFEQAAWLNPLPVEEVHAFELRVNREAGRFAAEKSRPKPKPKPEPPKTSLALLDLFLGMIDFPTEHREAFRAQFHVPAGFAMGEDWSRDEERAFAWLRQDAIARLLDERRGRLLDKLTEGHRDDERASGGAVQTSIGGIGFWRRDTGMDVADIMPLKQWRDEVSKRWCIIELPNDPVIPAWALGAVLQAAPADAFLDGVLHEFTTNTLRIRLRSIAFPRVEIEGFQMPPTVAATLDYATCTAKVSWPLRDDLENPKP